MPDAAGPVFLGIAKDFGRITLASTRAYVRNKARPVPAPLLQRAPDSVLQGTCFMDGRLVTSH